jgi:hypothetical protein
VAVSGTLQTWAPVTFDKNVTVNPGGHFKASNWGITINGNLQITDPAANSDNGFWGNQGGTANEVKGNVSYTITPAANYQMYQAPYLYFGGGTKVDGSVTYVDNGSGFHGGFDQGGLSAIKGVSVTGAAS